jgi:hypothetical protein
VRYGFGLAERSTGWPTWAALLVGTGFAGPGIQ